MRTVLALVLVVQTAGCAKAARALLRGPVRPAVVHDWSTPPRDPNPFAVPGEQVTFTDESAQRRKPVVQSAGERILAVLLSFFVGGQIPLIETDFGSPGD